MPAVAFEGHAVGADEELLEVPGDVVAADGGPDDVLRVGHQRGGVVVREGQRLSQEGEEGVRVLPVHLALLEQEEIGLVPVAGTNVLQREQDLLVRSIFLGTQEEKPPRAKPVRARPGTGGSSPLPGPRRPPYLVPELVAGEAEDLQPAGAVPPLQLVELQEVAGGGASERRHVGHQHHLPQQRAQRQRLRRAQRPRRHSRQPARHRARSRRRHGQHCRAGPASRPPLRPAPPGPLLLLRRRSPPLRALSPPPRPSRSSSLGAFPGTRGVSTLTSCPPPTPLPFSHLHGKARRSSDPLKAQNRVVYTSTGNRQGSGTDSRKGCGKWAKRKAVPAARTLVVTRPPDYGGGTGAAASC